MSSAGFSLRIVVAGEQRKVAGEIIIMKERSSFRE